MPAKPRGRPDILGERVTVREDGSEGQAFFARCDDVCNFAFARRRSDAGALGLDVAELLRDLLPLGDVECLDTECSRSRADAKSVFETLREHDNDGPASFEPGY